MDSDEHSGTQMRFCDTCAQKKPRTGFRGSECAECSVVRLERKGASKLARALHEVLPFVPSKERSARLRELLGT